MKRDKVVLFLDQEELASLQKVVWKGFITLARECTEAGNGAGPLARCGAVVMKVEEEYKKSVEPEEPAAEAEPVREAAVV